MINGVTLQVLSRADGLITARTETGVIVTLTEDQLCDKTIILTKGNEPCPKQ